MRCLSVCPFVCLPGGGTTGVFFLKLWGRAFKKFINCIPAQIPPPFYPQSQIWANSRNYPTAMPTLKGETAADILLKGCGGGFRKNPVPFSLNGTSPGNLLPG